MNGVVLIAIAMFVTALIMVIMGSGISGIADNALGALTQN